LGKFLSALYTSLASMYVHLRMILQPFVGPWPLFSSFLILYTVGRTPWTGDQPIAWPLRTHRTDIYAFSGIRTHDSSIRASEDSSCLRPCRHCERLHCMYQTYYYTQKFTVVKFIILHCRNYFSLPSNIEKYFKRPSFEKLDYVRFKFHVN
jgi:hypothetical protein